MEQTILWHDGIFFFFFSQLSWRWFHNYMTHLGILFSSCLMFHWTPVPRYISQGPISGYWGCSSLLWFQHMVLWISFPSLIEHTCEQICRIKCQKCKSWVKNLFLFKKTHYKNASCLLYPQTIDTCTKWKGRLAPSTHPFLFISIRSNRHHRSTST